MGVVQWLCCRYLRLFQLLFAHIFQGRLQEVHCIALYGSELEEAKEERVSLGGSPVFEGFSHV